MPPWVARRERERAAETAELARDPNLVPVLNIQSPMERWGVDTIEQRIRYAFASGGEADFSFSDEWGTYRITITQRGFRFSAPEQVEQAARRLAFASSVNPGEASLRTMLMRYRLTIRPSSFRLFTWEPRNGGTR